MLSFDMERSFLVSVPQFFEGGWGEKDKGERSSM